MSDKPTTNPSNTTTSSSSKPTCEFHSTAVIADKASLTGKHTIKIGENSIIQPYAKLNAAGGNITIGANCTVAEAVVLEVPDQNGDEVVLGDNVCVESSAHVTAATIGEGTEIGIQATVGAGAIIGKFCKLAPKQHIKPQEKLPDFTVVYGANQRRIDSGVEGDSALREARLKGQALHVEALKKFIPDASSKWTSA